MSRLDRWNQYMSDKMSSESSIAEFFGWQYMSVYKYSALDREAEFQREEDEREQS